MPAPTTTTSTTSVKQQPNISGGSRHTNRIDYTVVQVKNIDAPTPLATVSLKEANVRVFYAALSTETNSFSSIPTSTAAFARGQCRGPAVFDDEYHFGSSAR